MVASQLAAGACGVLIGIVLIAVSSRLSRRLWRESRRSAGPVRSGPAQCPHCGAPYDPADYQQGGPFPPTCEECGEPLGVVGT